MKRAVIYIRVSSDEQATGYSLSDQEERVRKYCSFNGMDVTAVFSDDHSAKNFNRPQWNKLLDYCKGHKRDLDYVLVVKWDRFGRNTTESYIMIDKLWEWGIEVNATEQFVDYHNVPESKILLGVYLVTPEVDNIRRSLNIRHAMRRANKEGRFINNAPYGYKNIRDDRKRGMIVPEESKAAMVRRIFEEIAGLQSPIEDVRRRMNRVFQLNFSRSQFNRLVRNPVYAGYVMVPAEKDEPEERIKGIHVPIVTETLFSKVQDVISGRARNKKKVKINPHFPLRGFLQCPCCGKMWTGSISKGRKEVYAYYHCREGCKQRVSVRDVEDAFYRYLRIAIPDAGALELYKDVLKQTFLIVAKDRVIDQEKNKVEIDRYKAKITNAMDELTDRRISAEDFREMKSLYKGSIEKLEREIEELKSIDSKFIQYLEGGITFLKGFENLFARVKTPAKKMLLEAFFCEPIYYENEAVRTARMNPVLEDIALNINMIQGIKKGLPDQIVKQSRTVVRTGIEPVLPE